MTNKLPTIVIDSNVLISAGILPQSRLAQVLIIAAEQFVIAQNEATWNELLSRIEREKFDRYFGENGRLGSLCITQRERMTCESGWDARQVLQPIAVAMGQKSNAADRPNRALRRREELCRGSLGYLSKIAQLVQFFDEVSDERVSRDADDDKFVSLALDANAKIIISGDRDLKEIKTHKGIAIMSPSTFLEQVNKLP